METSGSWLSRGPSSLALRTSPVTTSGSSGRTDIFRVYRSIPLATLWTVPSDLRAGSWGPWAPPRQLFPRLGERLFELGSFLPQPHTGPSNHRLPHQPGPEQMETDLSAQPADVDFTAGGKRERGTDSSAPSHSRLEATRAVQLFTPTHCRGAEEGGS